MAKIILGIFLLLISVIIGINYWEKMDKMGRKKLMIAFLALFLTGLTIILYLLND